MGKQSGTTIILLRCGRTDWDDAGRLQGATDLPLSESGRSELAAAVDAAFGDPSQAPSPSGAAAPITNSTPSVLNGSAPIPSLGSRTPVPGHQIPPPALIHCGPDEASRETARILAEKTDARVLRPDAALAGMNLGLWEGLLEGELEERFPTCFRQWRDDPAPVTPPEGEPFAGMASRLSEALSRLASRARGKAVAFVLRPIEFGLARCLLTDRPTSALWSMIEDGPAIEAHTLSPETVRELADGPRMTSRA